MAKQVQSRRGTTSQHSSFTGAAGEITVDTDKDVAVIHNGSTAGGFAMLGEKGGQTLTGGFAVTPENAGTKSSGTFTPDPDDGNFQYATNGGSHTLAAPAADCAIDILYTNNGSAGTITFSGFQVSSDTGDALTTTDGDDFLIQIRRINSIATYTIKALQ